MMNPVTGLPRQKSRLYIYMKNNSLHICSLKRTFVLFILNFSHVNFKAGFFSKKTADQFDQLLLNAVLGIFRCTLMILAIDSELNLSFKLSASFFVRYCSTPFFAESNTVQMNIFPIIVYEEFLVTAILDLIKSFLAGSFHFIKALCIL